MLRREAKLRSSNWFYVEVAKLLLFDWKASKFEEFVIACKLHIKIKTREMLVEKQMQWVLIYIYIYIQGKLADILK